MSRTPFHVMVKPIGALCNLRCQYCFYLSKTDLYPDTTDFRMDDATLERFVAQYIQAQPGPQVSFAWQGGEPTLMGLDFFRKVVQLQEHYLPSEWTCENALQTNGTLIDDTWCAFLADHGFLIGLSLDGPPHLHDVYRRDVRGQPTSPQVLRALELLKKHNVDYNILCVVNAVNAKQPREVYQYYRELGCKFLQFIPLVEVDNQGQVSSRSVDGPTYGHFLTVVFNEWVQHDLGDVFVQGFEHCVSAAAGVGAGVCVFAETCGRYLAMEHNGDLYACDHFVSPDYRLGNIGDTIMGALVDTSKQHQFGEDKRDRLTAYCRRCPVQTFCYGGCPKDWVGVTPDGEPGLSHLCKGYKQFFTYVQPFMHAMVGVLRQRQGPLKMREAAKKVYDRLWHGVGRNDLCPCGSGRKYKKCCS